MKALTKIDPDIAREEKEARQAARRLSSLRGLRHKTSAAGEGDDESEAAAAGLTVQPTEFRLTTPLAPPAPTVTIESARKRQPAASATVTRTNPTNTSSHGTTNTASDAAAGGSEGFQLPHSAPSHLGGGATKRYIPPAVLHGGLVSGESQMVVVDLLPARRDGTQFVRGEESSTMLVMKSTAELLNEARGPATLSDEVAEAVQRESATASAALEALFRKHPRKVVTTASLPPPPPPPLKEEGEKGPAAVAPPAPSPARLPQKLRTSVADSSTPTTIGAGNMLQRPTSSTASSSSHIITPQANVASPSGDRAAFTQWLESLQRLQHNFATRDTATDTLRMHCDVLRRRVVNLQQDAPEGESEEVAAGRRHLLAEVRYRLDAVQELLSSPCPLQTTTELFDGAIQKRSFTGSANPRHRTPIDGAKRYGAASPTTTATTNEPVAPIKVTPPTEVVRADVTPLSDAEVGTLIGFLRKGVPPSQAAASKQSKSRT
ncbi:Hypothetical protein, putative [Bodo saltans]|uniref:Uncharacterized protein n=1 Tax=Bodo saltans TaxID=75058 RepID=A0A0S4J3L1_BODSA|nr:Hypothetical protein, putative [Bodo saltans]|eukprot:CUG77159.1 Hypothetical protein, putative [Bodo saltans]